MRREEENEGSRIKNENAKLRNNSIFGKSVEHPTNKVDVKVVTTKKQYLKSSFIATYNREKLFCNGPVEKKGYQNGYQKRKVWNKF